MKYLWKSILILPLLLSSCSQGFSTRHTKITAYGMYAVHPAYGVLGVGYIEYEREPGGKEFIEVDDGS